MMEQQVSKNLSSTLSIRSPSPQDGQALHCLAKDTKTLDVNTEYAYALLGAHFAHTCAIAEDNDAPIGFVSAYIVPQQPETLFVWQVAVDSAYRGRGLAQMMIDNIVQRPACQSIRQIHTTISPSNEASKALFCALARKYKTEIKQTDFFSAGLFSGDHEAEDLFSVGPFSIKN